MHRYGAYWCHPEQYQTGFVIWSQLSVHQKIASTRQRFQIGDGITFINKVSDGVEFFHFATTPQNQKIMNFYLNNLDLFEKFSYYFKQKASHLIDKAGKNKYYLPDEFPAVQDLNCPMSLIKNDNLRKYFLDEIYLQSVNILPLSKRQFDCLYFLVNGRSIKQIAAAMTLSPKTVEHYLDAVKNKLDCFSRSELIEKALQMQCIKDKLNEVSNIC